MGRRIEPIVLEDPDWDELERLYGSKEDPEELRRQHEAAEEAWRIADETEPRAVSARYNPETRRIDIELRDGCMFAFPVDIAQGLRGASPEQLAKVSVDPFGFALHWDELNEGFTVPGLLERRFGNEHWMSQLAREMGRAKSPAKAAAARENGKKGGRPRKSAPK